MPLIGRPVLRTVQLDTRPSGPDVSSPMSGLNGRGSSLTATAHLKRELSEPMHSTRRVRHEVADALRLAAFSLAASAAVAVLLSLGAHLLVGAA